MNCIDIFPVLLSTIVKCMFDVYTMQIQKEHLLSRRVFELYRICNELVEKLLKRSNFNASDTFLYIYTPWTRLCMCAFDFSLWFHCLLHNVKCICEVMWTWIIGDKVQGVAIFFLFDLCKSQSYREWTWKINRGRAKYGTKSW